MANSYSPNEDETYKYYQKLANEAKATNNAIIDTEYNAYVQQANAQKNQYALGANQTKAGLYQADQLAQQKLTNLYANAGLGGGAGQAPRSGVSETAQLQQQLNLQNNISAVNAEERAAIKSLNDLILQNKQEVATSKLGNENNYLSAIAQAYEKGNAAFETRRSNFTNMAADATTLDDLETYAKLAGVDNGYLADYKQGWGKSYANNGGTLTPEQIKTIYGADSPEAKEVETKVQETNYNSLNSELSALLAKEGVSVEEIDGYLAKADEEYANKKITKDDISNLYANYMTNTIAGKVTSTAAYNAVLGDINSLETEGKITSDKKAELLAELAKSDYNPNGFKAGGKYIDGSKISFRYVTNGGTDRENAWTSASGQDLKVTIDGKDYWVEFGGVVTLTKNTSKLDYVPVGGFAMLNGKLVYKESKNNIRYLGDVKNSASGQKRDDLIQALQAYSVQKKEG